MIAGEHPDMANKGIQAMLSKKPIKATAGQKTDAALLNEYLSQGIHTVHGWCIPQLWQSLWPLYQRIGNGPVAEIGVFEGKFFIGLAKTFGSSSSHVAIDVFDMQEFNLDKAGVGKIDVFQDNLKAHGVPLENVTCLQADSLMLNTRDALELYEKFGGFKFFSVDGCHQVTHTVRDIEFAMSVTLPEGIIAVDDYLNADWPGVGEAVAKMYLLHEYPFVPLLFTCNKLLLCSQSYHAEYLELVESYLQANFPQTRLKKVVRFGHDTLTIRPNMQEWHDLPVEA